MRLTPLLDRSRSDAVRAAISLAVAATILLLAACVSSDQTVGLWLRVTNATDQTLTLTYEEPGHQMNLGTVEPGRLLLIESVFEQLGPSCHGAFLARSANGEEIGRLEQACPNMDWSIKPPG